MPIYLALFRGINVSGKKIIKMEDLRRHMAAEGYTNVTTYIQSGNVAFTSESISAKTIAGTIEAMVAREYGFDVSVFVINVNQLREAVDNNPFTQGREEEPSGFKKLYVTFLSDVPSTENIEMLKKSPIGNDRVEFIGQVLYFMLESKASDSKLSNSLIESKLKLRATTRNWNTTLKLLSMTEV